jgi:hypothetical protein
MQTRTIIIIFFLFLLFLVNIDFILRWFGYEKACPHKIEGNPDASLQISYFESVFCFACWLEKPVLEKLITEKGNEFALLRFDSDDCREHMLTSGLVGVPSWVFNQSGNVTKAYGFLSEEQLASVIGTTKTPQSAQSS